MMMDDVELCPFDRERVGKKNDFLIRKNRFHVEEAAKAIRRRNHPAWSQYREEVRAA
jgi:hypothetical protein